MNREVGEGAGQWRHLQESLVEIMEAEVDHELTPGSLEEKPPWEGTEATAPALSHTIRKALNI